MVPIGRVYHTMAPNLNPQQQAASQALFSPLLIVAGAGTGKTTTLTHRLAHLIKEGIPPRRVCALTFTNKAAKEMYDRATSLVPFRGSKPFIGTFHALGASILRHEARHAGRTANFAIFDDRDSFALVKQAVKDLAKRSGGDEAAESRKSARRAREAPGKVAGIISEMKNKGGLRGADERGVDDDEFSFRAFRLYEEKLLAHNAFDFDDLIDTVVRLFAREPAILKKYRAKFDALLVDEYQDLNPRQYELVKLLAGEHMNISVVGDDEQLIYGWRYANLGTFLNFEADWPGARVAFLEENYRSSGNIIAAAAEVSSRNQFRRPKQLWTKNPPGAQIRIAETMDENEEGEWIANQLELRIANTELGEKESSIPNSKFKIPSVAVLYRTNAQSRAIEQALLRRGIPYRIFGGVKFYERKEIKDVLAALRYAWNPKDALSRERLGKLLAKKKFADLVPLLSRGISSPTKLIETFLAATDYLGYLEHNFANYLERQENVAELIRFAAKFDRLGDFLQDVALLQATDVIGGAEEKDAPRAEAHLMTIHIAKGLEFDAVFIAGASEGLLPHARSLDNLERLEEERRLMYVAMTRAKRELLISYYDMPSRFIGEIPKELIEFESRAEARNEVPEERFVTLD